ncbi:MAG: LysM peptidoglycan-binding domain-containing protein [Bacteroidales bacterium]
MMISCKKQLAALTFVLICINALLPAQEPVHVTRSDNKVILEGKVYYVHLVKAGQTLYSIARAYNVSEKEILIENPGAIAAELTIGQVLKIPSDPASAFSVDTGEGADRKKNHILKPGETLYSLSRRYDCTVEDLLKLNPGIDINDIPVGQKILLPPDETVRNELSFDEEGYLFHKVKKGETLYSIARYYGVSLREIRSVNLELGWGGPKSGDVLRIPQPSTTSAEIFSPAIVPVDSVSEKKDMVIIEDSYTYDEMKEEEYFPERMYRVAYLIPFDYHEMEPLDSLLKDVNSPIRRERIRENYRIASATPQSVNFLEFLEGSLMAIDELTNEGFRVDLKVYDTKNSMSRTRKILEEPAFSEVDLIIGPFFRYNLELVTEFSKNNRIPMVTPFYSSEEMAMENPYLFQPTPSYKTEYRNNAAFIGRLYNNNLILVHQGDSSWMEQISFYKEALFEEIEKYSAVETVLFKEVVIIDGNTEGLVHSLNPDISNLIILPSVDEAFASMVSGKLFYELQNYDIEVFGSSYWSGFNNIELSYIHALNLKISHTHWEDHHDPGFLEFLNNFRKNYIREPESYYRLGYNYGVTGYNLSIFFLSALHQYGNRFLFHLDDHHEDSMVYGYDFIRVSPAGGYENRALNYYYFNKDLNVERIQLPERPPLHHYLQPAGDDPIYFWWSDPDPDSTDHTNTLNPE